MTLLPERRADTAPAPDLSRIDEFLACNPQLPTPFLVLDLDIVRDRYRALRAALPQAGVWYAVKANPDAAVVALLAELGSSFDVASVGEVDLCLGLGVHPNRLSYGNTVKKERDLAAAYERGVRTFAVDCPGELAKVVRQAPGSRVLVRLSSECDGADWPLSRKFGCSYDEAEALLVQAAGHGLELGVSFHVGSQQRDTLAWNSPLATVARLAESLRRRGHRLSAVNLGGGLPSNYYVPTPQVGEYGTEIDLALDRHLGPDHGLEVMIEPGRYLVGDAGVIRSEVVLVTRKDSDADRRWIYLDVGQFNGLAETQDEAIRYLLRCPEASGPLEPAVVAGPTCDSVDVLYERDPYPLPVDLADGQPVDVLGTGAYTTTYSSVWFNGFEALRSYALPATPESDLRRSTPGLPSDRQAATSVRS